MHTRHTITKSEQGTTIAIALITCAILTTLGATSFMVIQDRYRLAHQTARWQDALLPAEAGIDFAVNEVRKQLYMADLSRDFFPSSFDLDGDGVADGGWERGEPFNDTNRNGMYDDGEVFQDLNGNGIRDAAGYSCTLSLKSDSDHRVWFTVQAEELSPETMGLPIYADRFWRVRSIGSVSVSSGATAVAGEKMDIQLRKLSLLTDRRTKKKLNSPQATRVIEAILKPISTFRVPFFAVTSIDLTDHTIVIDSFDSLDPNKSTYDPSKPNIPGKYDPAKQQKNGDVATNGDVINAGGAHIYGDVATHSGTEGVNGVTKGENITGDITTGFYQEVAPVNTPKGADGKTDIPADPGTLTTIRSSATIQASATSIAQIRVDKINLSGSDTLRIQGQTDSTTHNPIPTYVQIVVGGDIDVSGLAQVIIDPGVFVRIFVAGNVNIGGVVNPNSALHLQLYGIDHYRKDAAGNILKDSSGNPIIDYGTFKIAGNGGFSGAVYAPHYNVEIKGGGSSGDVYAAIVGNTIKLTGGQSIHYDEALGRGGLVGEYKVVSWMEDVR